MNIRDRIEAIEQEIYVACSEGDWQRSTYSNSNWSSYAVKRSLGLMSLTLLKDEITGIVTGVDA